MTEIPVEGNVLRWARLYRGLTEKDAAKRLGISVTELSAYENNERKPTLGMFETFAAQYQLPQATLFRLYTASVTTLSEGISHDRWGRTDAQFRVQRST